MRAMDAGCGHVVGEVDGKAVTCGGPMAYKGFCWAHRNCSERIARDSYLPLYAEKRCGVCGYWRGQHIGMSGLDSEMLCPLPAPSHPVSPVPPSFISAAARV